MNSIWFLYLLSGDILVYLCVSFLGNILIFITKIFLLQDQLVLIPCYWWMCVSCKFQYNFYTYIYTYTHTHLFKNDTYFHGSYYIIHNFFREYICNICLTIYKTFVFFRTIVALGHLVLSCNHQLYSKLIDYLVDDLSTQPPAARSKTSIQCIAAIW